MDWFSRGLPALTRALLTSQSNSDHWFLWRNVWGEGTERKNKKVARREKDKKKTLSEQSRRLPTWLECNSMSDLHISSVRRALGCHLFHLSLTWKRVCIPNGWRRGWATAPSDSEGSIRQVRLFFISPVCLRGCSSCGSMSHPAVCNALQVLLYCHPVVSRAGKKFAFGFGFQEVISVHQ